LVLLALGAGAAIRGAPIHVAAAIGAPIARPSAAVVTPPRANDDFPDPGDSPNPCLVNAGVGLDGAPYVNGLPVIQQSLEIVGEFVKVVVVSFDCFRVTPASLPFEWQVTGPSGPVVLEDGGTLRPHFRPVVAGDYEARLTYCPQTCPGLQVGAAPVDIPPLTATWPFRVVSQMPIPPATHTVLTPTALQFSPLESHEESDRKCAGPSRISDAHTPQLVPVHPWNGAGDYRLLEGQVSRAAIAYNDNELNHESHDIGVHVRPDPQHWFLLTPGKLQMDVEWESDTWPGPMRPVAGDRISAFGFHTYDCHHSPISTEIHPPVLTAVHRTRAVRIPDAWAPQGSEPLGSNLWVPGVITDIWANVRAGEISSNCSSTGLHQEAPDTLTPFVYGDCIQSPHPIQRSFTFNIYLPEDPQKRAAAAGLSAPPAPLYVRVEPGTDPLPVVLLKRDPMTADGVPFLQVTLDLTGFSGQTYQGRIVAAWVLPSATNWGLEQWKVGIPSLEVFDDLDTGTDGDWVFWAATNNRDQEWTRLLNGDSVGEGIYTFGDRPWETEPPESPWSPSHDRSLGPHLLLFNAPFSQYFPASSLIQAFQVHTSGYDAEFWDDDVGVTNALECTTCPLALGERVTRAQVSSTAAYRLNYYYERLGPVAGANLTAAGRSLAAAYTVGAGGRCSQVARDICLLLPESPELTIAWDPSQEPAPVDVDFDWSAHPIFKRQEPEPFSLTDMPLEQLGRAVLSMLQRDPQAVQRFFQELREEFDGVRGTPTESEYARALLAFEPHLPAEQWQLYMGDIDPTPVDLALTRITMSPPGGAAGESVVFAAEIENRGTGAAAPFVARLSIDGVALPLLPIPALAPGAITAVEFAPWTAAAGRHKLRAAADALAQIAEPKEGDNELERRIAVRDKPLGLPDLLIPGARVRRASRDQGRGVVFVAHVENSGGNALDAFVVDFSVDGSAVGSVVVPGLAARRTIALTSPAWEAHGRRHTLRVAVDPAGRVAESDEDNNTLARRFVVSDPPDEGDR
jgi:hypothetical protein